MNIINIMCCYNELEYLPKTVRYYQSQGIPVYVADNCSTDGTWEWLNDNRIPCEQFDTDGCFDLLAQQSLRTRLARRFPEKDWVIYGDADEYIVTRMNLDWLLRAADQNNCNIIKMKTFNLYNTGEERGKDATRTYFYYKERFAILRGIERIYRNLPEVDFYGDSIVFPDVKILKVRWGVVLNYGGTKTLEQREDVYQRRVRAWDKDLLPRKFGWHYELNQKRGWLWPKEELLDLREHEDYSYIKPRVIDFDG